MGAAIIGGLIVGGSAIAAGEMQNSAAEDQNQAMLDASRSDYKDKLSKAQQGLKQINKQYNDIVKQRPDLTWTEFITEKLKNSNDPFVRNWYLNAKEEDFNKLQQFAQRASQGNVDTLIEAADDLSGGQWQNIMQKRNDLVLNTDAASRYQRSYELAAPILNDATTVQFDDQGRLIENQRAGKQAFNIANEVQTQVEQEQKNDLRQLENDRLSAAQSQIQKASDFSGFFDPTGYATNLANEQAALELNRQTNDETRAWDLYTRFAQAAAGITATQPSYVNPNPGNDLVSQGIKTLGTAATDYYTNQKTQTAAKTTPSTSNTYG